MNLMEMAVDMLAGKLGIDSETAGRGLQALMGDNGGGLDIASLVSSFQQGGLGDLVGSWLGDGDNQAVDGATIESTLGTEKISAAAQTMGIDSGSLLGGLSDVIPQVVDKASSGGSLLDMAGGLGGVADLAKKLF